MKKNPSIFVTQPFLPPLEEFREYLGQIWEEKILTNNGRFHQQLEEELCKYLGVKYISLFSNGTLALMTALQALRITGEVITTPYSFVATTHALWWNNIKPVFSDISSDGFNIDPNKIESAITTKTTAILPVHVYGFPCDIDRIQIIAEKYGLKVIYDACHTFDVRMGEIPLLNFGDLSVMSFHATKVFTTFEGGAIVSHDESMKKRIDNLKNFGFEDEITVVTPGINAKMNELQAAMGLIQLRYIKRLIEKREEITLKYFSMLKSIRGIELCRLSPSVKYSYPYFPILIHEEHFGKSRDYVYNEFKKLNIFCRRYFYPLISHFPIYKGLASADQNNLPNAEKVAKQVLCLPLYPSLDLKYVDTISECLSSWSKS